MLRNECAFMTDFRKLVSMLGCVTKIQIIKNPTQVDLNRVFYYLNFSLAVISNELFA